MYRSYRFIINLTTGLRVQINAEYFCSKMVPEDRQVGLNDYAHIIGLIVFIVHEEPMIRATVAPDLKIYIQELDLLPLYCFNYSQCQYF